MGRKKISLSRLFSLSLCLQRLYRYPVHNESLIPVKEDIQQLPCALFSLRIEQ